MTATEFVVSRDVTVEECGWLAETIPRGTTVYCCHKPTYGCIGDGMAVTLDSEGDYPFFELPRDSVVIVQGDHETRVHEAAIRVASISAGLNKRLAGE